MPFRSALALVFGLGLLGASAVRNKRKQTSEDCYSTYDGQKLLSLKPCTEAMLQEMTEALSECVEIKLHGLKMPASGCLSEEAICSPAVAEDLLKRFGDHVSELSSDAGAFYRLSSGTSQPFVTRARSLSVKDGFYSNWRNLDDVMSRVQSVVDASGGVAQMTTFGTSVEGRPLKAVNLTGEGYKPGMPRLVFTFNLHAREWITGMAGVYAVEQMVARAKADPQWLVGTEIVLVPMANPDGFDFSHKSRRFWRKNRAKKGGWFGCDGVDLNRNFPTDWNGKGSTSSFSCSDVYVGPSSASEPETLAIMKLFQQAPMKVQIDVHSFTELILASWSYTSEPHPRKDEIFELGYKMQKAMQKNGVTYAMGDNLLYEASGVVSDYSTSLGALGYTYELRPKSGGAFGFAPPASDIEPCAEETLEGLYAAVEWAQA